jgi:DNA end-binding protein Ku
VVAERAAWVGTIAVGAVTVPVKLWRAAQPRDIAFNYLHRTCGARIQHKRWCSLEQVEVPWEEVSRGFEFAPDEYVVLTQEDFERLPLSSRHVVAISAFSEPGEIDPVYYERSYYVVPDHGGERAYVLLLRTLAERNVSAIGTIAIRNKEQLCAIRAERAYLVLDTLYYADEVEDEPNVGLGGIRLREDEREMARTLVELMRRPFRPAAYEDRYRMALASVIEAKIHGARPMETPSAGPPPMENLADALARSVEAAMRDETSAGREEGPPPARQAS